MGTKITLSDVTLRNLTTNAENAFSFNEKLEIARQLDKLCVDVIETAPIGDVTKKTDVLFLHSVASLLKNSTLACVTGLTEDSIEETYNAIKNAQDARLIISVPVSTVQMEYICSKKPAKVLEMIEALTKKAASLCENVEVSLLDSTRAEKDFLASAIFAAINNGAKTITLCDDAGTMLPGEFGDYIKEICEANASLSEVTLGVECNNKLHMATADAVSAIDAGVKAVKVSITGASATNLANFVAVLRDKADRLGVESGIDLSRVEHAIHKINLLTTSKNTPSATVFDAGTAATPFADITITASDDFKSVYNAVVKMGYELSDDDMKNVFAAVQKAAAKKNVEAKELDSIIAGVAMQVPPTYKLKSYVINSGDIITPTANIELLKNGEAMRGFCIGDGPIDAAFLAIEKITGHHYELDEFRIESVTGGYEALGSTIVRLRHNGKLYSGIGVSTDIVGASISAYINALNKICFEEDAK